MILDADLDSRIHHLAANFSQDRDGRLDMPYDRAVRHVVAVARKQGPDDRRTHGGGSLYVLAQRGDDLPKAVSGLRQDRAASGFEVQSEIFRPRPDLRPMLGVHYGRVERVL